MFLIALVMVLSMNSCEVYTHATPQEDIYIETQEDIVQSNVDFSIVIQHGTPYYYNGSLLYYLYNGFYYYPFYYDNYWYVRAYRRPFVYVNHRPYFRPHKYDYRFSPGHYRGFDRPYNPNIGRPHRPHGRPNNPNFGRPNGRPHVRPTNPNFGRPNGRPMNPNMGRPNGRSGSRPNNNRGRFGK